MIDPSCLFGIQVEKKEDEKLNKYNKLKYKV